MHFESTLLTTWSQRQNLTEELAVATQQLQKNPCLGFKCILVKKLWLKKKQTYEHQETELIEENFSDQSLKRVNRKVLPN